jgi:hypothetical protein
MATETRVVRPYQDIAEAQRVLERWVYRVGDDTFPPDSLISIPRSEFVAAGPAIAFDGSDEEYETARDELRTALSAIGLTGEQVEFMLGAGTPRLKLHDVVYSHLLGIDIELPREIVVDRTKARALRTPFGGCTIEVALCLAREIEPDTEYPLRPHRKGTWLARSTLQLRTTSDRAGFPVYPLTAEERARLDLSDETIRYVVLEAPLQPSESSELRVYLDADLYSRVNAQPNSPGSRALQRELWVSTMTAIVLESVRSPELANATLDDLDETWLGRLIEWVSGPRREDQQTWLETIKDHPSAFVSQIDVLAQSAADWQELI